MNVTKFYEKLNKLENNIYVIEEVVEVLNGVYESELQHDNVNLKTLNVYTGSKLTGNKIEAYFTSTPSLAPWKTIIKIYSNVSPIYISYETSGDQVEAGDINNLQDAVVETQENLNSEIYRATGAEKVLTDNLNTEINRAKGSEDTLNKNLSNESNRAKNSESAINVDLENEVNRAKAAENTLNNNLIAETNRAKGAEDVLTKNLSAEVTRATNAENTLINNLTSESTRAKSAENTLTSTINANTPIWNDKYTKNEVDNKISQVVSNMDWKESVATYADIATTYPNPQDGWTVNVKDTDITYRYSGTSWIPISANSIPLASSSVDGKMSKQDKIDHDDMNSKKHTHSNRSILDIINQTLIDNWNAAYTHVSDVVKHITSTERTNWNTAYTNNHTHNNKSVLDGITSALISNWNSAYTHISDAVKHITSTERTNWNEAYSKEHDHSNKSLIDTITQALIDKWNAAYSHISDTVKHITSDERTLWNTVSNKFNSSGGDITGNVKFPNDSKLEWTRNTDYARISFKNTSDGDSDSYMQFLIGDNGNEYFKFDSVNGSTTTELLTIKSDYLRYKGNKVYHESNKPTPADIGLGNVENTSDLSKPISTAVQSALNGKANSSHTHDDRYYTETEADSKFATKSEISQAGYGDMLKSIYDTNNNGVVDRAEKLATTRKINLNGDVTGTVIFDGSEDASITTSSRQIAFIGSDAASSNGWYKVASQTMSGYGNTNIMFAVCSTYGNYYAGILELQMRTDNTSISCRALTWLSKYGFNINHFIIVINGMTWTLYVYRDFGQYGRLAFEILSSSSIGNKQQAWALIFSDNNTKETNAPTATTISSDVKKTLTWNDLKGV
ncbi:hypothetical protein CBE01nite_35670 [Clostridium beijerinckii]|uniref:Uncharacterized protein n=1 Tax=Clostridium beijerinckii TaxID=1520 RepID=A0AB74VID9_CLOBE|nr:hypothetical protein [Clostridium beijerinckii]NRZ25177.1 hemoglobin-like flavoprotein [Clostridium beijerinckii]NYB99891.1 hemoglobin-like flavoprotein [Clostridium beijerinckii]OOM26458.1 hypothetical protein CLBEI_10520 [Clostridium beijerinckii]QUN35964.1 hypothetical protein KEC93_03795 [Clostridium beijerinckii]SQB13352.1 Uncharacterised protein [Clostridium beijerinckii]